MIRNIYDKETRLVAEGERSRKLPLDIQPRAFNLLKLIAAANQLTKSGSCLARVFTR